MSYQKTNDKPFLKPESWELENGRRFLKPKTSFAISLKLTWEIANPFSAMGVFVWTYGLICFGLVISICLLQSQMIQEIERPRWDKIKKMFLAS